MSLQNVVYEMITASATDAYAADSAILNEALDLIATQTSHPILSGPQLDAPPSSPKLYVFIGWDSIAVHLSARKSPAHARLQPALDKVFSAASAPDVVHVRFLSDALPALRAPVTEIACLTAKTGADDKAAGDQLLEATQRAIELFGFNSRGAACGKVVEREGQIVAVAGWDSIEEHLAFRARRNSVMKAIAEVWYSTAHVTLSYAALVQHGGTSKSKL